MQRRMLLLVLVPWSSNQHLRCPTTYRIHKRLSIFLDFQKDLPYGASPKIGILFHRIFSASLQSRFLQASQDHKGPWHAHSPRARSRAHENLFVWKLNQAAFDRTDSFFGHSTFVEKVDRKYSFPLPRQGSQESGNQRAARG